MAKPMQVGYVEIGRLFWLSPARQHGETEREIAADCRRRPSEISRGLPVTESQGRCGIPTSSCLLVLLCRTATHSSCRDPNRGGNRQANAALYRVVIVRMRGHQPTLDYVRRRTAEGKGKMEIIRCLKRFVAREIFGYLCRASRAPTTVPSTS